VVPKMSYSEDEGLKWHRKIPELLPVDWVGRRWKVSLQRGRTPHCRGKACLSLGILGTGWQGKQVSPSLPAVLPACPLWSEPNRPGTLCRHPSHGRED
jgi:hypothetical protein